MIAVASVINQIVQRLTKRPSGSQNNAVNSISVVKKFRTVANSPAKDCSNGGPGVRGTARSPLQAAPNKIRVSERKLTCRESDRRKRSSVPKPNSARKKPIPITRSADAAVSGDTPTSMRFLKSGTRRYGSAVRTLS
jgi:hypothetical protein